MKHVLFLAASVVIATSTPGLAAPLDADSLAPAWSKASPAEKDAWIATFQFKKADANKAAVAACLDQYAGKPLFEANALSGVTGMCESIAALPN
jgi:hypothetical protein